MNPKSFIIVFMVILAMLLIATPSELPKSHLIVMKRTEIFISTMLNSGECDRTKILLESALRHAQEYDYKVTCTPIDK